MSTSAEPSVNRPRLLARAPLLHHQSPAAASLLRRGRSARLPARTFPLIPIRCQGSKGRFHLQLIRFGHSERRTYQRQGNPKASDAALEAQLVSITRISPLTSRAITSLRGSRCGSTLDYSRVLPRTYLETAHIGKCSLPPDEGLPQRQQSFHHDQSDPGPTLAGHRPARCFGVGGFDAAGPTHLVAVHSDNEAATLYAVHGPVLALQCVSIPFLPASRRRTRTGLRPSTCPPSRCARSLRPALQHHPPMVLLAVHHLAAA